MYSTAIIKPQRRCFLSRGANLDLDVDVDIQDADDIDNAIDSFMNKLKQAATQTTSRIQYNTAAYRQQTLPSVISDLIRLKRRVRREYARTGDARIQHIQKRLANHLQKVLARRKQIEIDNMLEN